MEIQAFVPAESIDPIRIGEGYYLQPDGQVAAKPYVLLVQALERSSKVAVAKFAWSKSVSACSGCGTASSCCTRMKCDDGIRNPAELVPEAVELTAEEIAEAEHLIDRLSRDDLVGEEFTDRYTDAVAEIIKAKREYREPPVAPTAAEAKGQVLDLMAALQESVAKAKAPRGESGDADRARAAEEEGRGQEDGEEDGRQEDRREEDDQEGGSEEAAPQRLVVADERRAKVWFIGLDAAQRHHERGDTPHLRDARASASAGRVDARVRVPLRAPPRCDPRAAYPLQVRLRR
ncbi:Ku protein [Streptomyces sp. NBC_00038]|uniref:Ku protein n=1 Tax=Streptomyces sp. NBC_00038 TaxID=2903615 RepID=UPI00225060A6|nr:Ku protein [Streptomyces sp. NBC_00038]MCX5562882.1 hypothetical protein [Streptomyces sp. NBC_00038]